MRGISYGINRGYSDSIVTDKKHLNKSKLCFSLDYVSCSVCSVWRGASRSTFIHHLCAFLKCKGNKIRGILMIAPWKLPQKPEGFSTLPSQTPKTAFGIFLFSSKSRFSKTRETKDTEWKQQKRLSQMQSYLHLKQSLLRKPAFFRWNLFRLLNLCIRVVSVANKIKKSGIALCDEI